MICSNFAVFEVERESEFAPLKNADSAGIDCPQTSRSAVYKLHTKWLQQNGATISRFVCIMSINSSYSKTLSKRMIFFGIIKNIGHLGLF